MGLTQLTRRLTNFFAAKGDLLTWDGAAVGATLLSIGTTGQVLTVAAGTPAWATPSAALTTANFVYNETPTGTVNGTNAAFTTANAVTPASSVRVYVNGVRMASGGSADYTFSTPTITFNAGAIPQTGDVLLVDYMK